MRSSARPALALPPSAAAALAPFATAEEALAADDVEGPPIEPPPEAAATAPEHTEPEPDRVLAADAPAAVVPATPAPDPLPRRGRISYTLFLGTEKFEIGRTVQTWEFGEGAYRIGSVSETGGLAAVFRAERRTYLSEGAVTPAGLRPRAFLMSRAHGARREVARARFDWDAGSLTWGTADAKNEAVLPPGAQDFLSLLYQLALLPPAAGRIALPITTGTRFEIYELDVLPEETIETPLGALRALPLRQVRRPGAESIAVWLAVDHRHLPVQVRFYGRDGRPSGEQVVNEITLADDRQSPELRGVRAP